jgi:RAQPRD family integrative conjugative element protein
MRVLVLSLLAAGSLALPGDRVQAVGIEQASRIYLNHAAALIRQAQRYASRSHATYVLPGFDYQKFMQEVDTVGDGVETFLHPRPGDPGPVVPVEIDGQFISEELWRQGNALQEEVGASTPEALEDPAEEP